MNEKNKTTLNDIVGIITSEEVEGRFQEIISTQKIKDTRTGKIYDGQVDTELLRLINFVDERNQNRKKEIDELMEVNNLLWDMVDGFHAYCSLKNMGYIE